MAGFDFQLSVLETQLTFSFCFLISQTTSERCSLRNTISPIIEALSFVSFFRIPFHTYQPLQNISLILLLNPWVSLDSEISLHLWVSQGFQCILFI